MNQILSYCIHTLDTFLSYTLVSNSSAAKAMLYFYSVLFRKNSEYDQEMPQSQTANDPWHREKSHTTIRRHQED